MRNPYAFTGRLVSSQTYTLQMNLLLLGATGRTGRLILEEARLKDSADNQLALYHAVVNRNYPPRRVNG